MKKGISIFLFFFFGLSFYQCFDCNCGPTLPYFDINGFSINHNTKSGGYIFTKVDYSDYNGFSVNFSASYIGSLLEKKSSYFAPNALLACDCETSGSGGSKSEKFKELNILTVNHFDNAHTVRSNINEFFQIKDKDGIWKDLNTFLKTDTSNIFSQFIDFKITKLPPREKPFQVEIQMKVADNELYSVLSREIEFF